MLFVHRGCSEYRIARNQGRKNLLSEFCPTALQPPPQLLHPLCCCPCLRAALATLFPFVTAFQDASGHTYSSVPVWEWGELFSHPMLTMKSNKSGDGSSCLSGTACTLSVGHCFLSVLEQHTLPFTLQVREVNFFSFSFLRNCQILQGSIPTSLVLNFRRQKHLIVP